MGFNSYLMNGLILEKEKVVNPAHFYPNWAGLAVLFSKQIPISSKDFYFSVKTVKTNVKECPRYICPNLYTVNFLFFFFEQQEQGKEQAAEAERPSSPTSLSTPSSASIR